MFLAVNHQASEEHFKVGYQEAMGEAVRFLVEVRGYSPADPLCVQMTSHMQRHVEAVTKGKNCHHFFPLHQVLALDIGNLTYTVCFN